MVSRYSAYRREPDTVSPDLIDRILVGACAAVWLLLIGVSVAASVALVDLGSGFHKTARNPHTTWVLYAVIIVSALIIAGAIPILLRARRADRHEPVVRSVALAGRSRPPVRPKANPHSAQPGSARSGPVRAFSEVNEWSGAAVDRVWLRGMLGLTGTMGIALIGVATATYLMSVGHDAASWVCYGLAGAATAAMPVVELLHVRQLRRLLATH
jgi:Protein of unknown function (DUF2561)